MNFKIPFQEIIRLYISETELPREDLNEVVEKSFQDRFHVPKISLCRKIGNTFSREGFNGNWHSL